VISRKQDADGVDLVALRLEDDTLHRVRAKYVIAADGGSSPTAPLWGSVTRENLRGPLDRDRREGQEALAEIGKLRFHCDPSRPTVDCPDAAGAPPVGVSRAAGRRREGLVTEAAVLKLLSRLHISAEHVDILRAVT